MTWINYEHHNVDAPPGSFGGARCMCSDCCDERALKEVNLEYTEHKCGNCGHIIKVFKEQRTDK